MLGPMGIFREVDDHLAQPYRTRRWVLLLSTIIALGLAVYVNVVGHELHGESLLIALVGGATATYGATKVFGQLGSTPEDQQDI